ncbi:prolipoprotein diacylglyceryl transferase [Candidatus Omnitrophota bacterium]
MEKLILWWQHLPENIQPVIFSIGPMQVRWYGLMYIAAFLTVYLIVLYRIKTERFQYDRDTIIDFLFWAMLGVFIGGRFGYVVFYDLSYFLAHPLEIICPFTFSDGFRYTGIYGMSYHGGLLGVATAFTLFCRKRKISLWHFADLFIPAITAGYTFGRLGNFINGELYGRITKVPWGMYFPLDSLQSLRHPSQLYEAFFEGIFLFVILWSLRKKKYFDGFLFSLYFIGYGLVRFFIEFVREPDSHLGFIVGSFTMGQILCFCMIVAGAALFFVRKSHGEKKNCH